MNIFVDENIPNITVNELENLGHLVMDIRGTDLEGSPDEIVWLTAQNQKCLLVTTDKGFSKHRFENHFGILIVCLRQPNQFKINQRIIAALKNSDEMEWSGKIIMIKDYTTSSWLYQSN